MRELSTVDTFTVTGRGVGHVVHVGDTVPELHEHVLLDGQDCEIVGVAWPIKKGETAILVKRAEY